MTAGTKAGQSIMWNDTGFTVNGFKASDARTPNANRGIGALQGMRNLLTFNFSTDQ